MPRKAEEITRSTASYKAQSCEVKTNGGRLEVSFPGVEMGIFAGRLQYTGLQRHEPDSPGSDCEDDQESVAYKYDAGFKGLAIQPSSKLAWRDITNMWQENRLEAAVNKNPATVVAANRLLASEAAAGSLTVFPPPTTSSGRAKSR